MRSASDRVGIVQRVDVGPDVAELPDAVGEPADQQRPGAPARRSPDRTARRTSRAGCVRRELAASGAQDGSSGKPCRVCRRDRSTVDPRSALGHVRDRSERIDELKLSAGHSPGEVLGMIVHGHVEQVEQDQARPPVDLQEPPEPLAVLARGGRRRGPGSSAG